MVGGRRSSLKKFVPPAAAHQNTQDNKEAEADGSVNCQPMDKINGELALELNLLNIKQEKKEMSPKTAKTVQESSQSEKKLDIKVDVTNVPQMQSCSEAILDSKTWNSIPKKEASDDLEESTLSTIDAANLGIHSWILAEPQAHSTPIVPVNQPKKRGRKPKPKIGPVESKAVATPLLTTFCDDPCPTDSELKSGNVGEPCNAPKEMRFPQSIVNGIISIDMSSVCMNPELPSNVLVTITDDTREVEVEIEKKKKKTVGKKSESAPKPKRGRPKRPKQEQDSSSSPAISPVKKPAKRGRKIKDTPPTLGIWTSKKIVDYQPEDHRKFEVEILKTEDLIGLGATDIFSFGDSEFNKITEGAQIWFPIDESVWDNRKARGI